MNYRKLGVIEFGEALLKSLDLDPVYVLLYQARLPKEQLQRWCVAYWMFYHVGVASELSEYESYSFWERILAVLSSAPRGTERRHFRGERASKTVKYLWHAYSLPEFFLESIFDWPRCTFQEVVKHVTIHPQFGPWIAFKVADMGDRVLGYNVDFSS